MTQKQPDAAFASSGWTVPGLLQARSALTPAEPALWQMSAEGEWRGNSWRDYEQTAAALSNGFRRLGLRVGERVGIMAPTSREWDFAQLGVLAAGGVAVGLDPFALDEHLRAIATRCDFAGLVLAHSALLDRLGEDVRRRLRFVVCVDSDGDRAVTTLEQLRTESGETTAWNQAQADAPATILFTSGTTGEPKGIVYNHRQMCLAVVAILSAFADVPPGSRLACWLPLANPFQRMINLSAIRRGAQTFYVSDPREIMRHIKEIAPHLFIGVPRFYEKLYAGIQDVVARQPGWQQRLVRWALRVGEHAAADERAGRRKSIGLRLESALADRLVLVKLRAALGPNLSFLVSGSAAMPLWLLERFDAIGLRILEAYGVSENIIPVSINRPERFRFGSVGQSAEGSDVRLADDGELLVRGPGVFSGYFGEENAVLPLDADGFLATGDYARTDADGFITLIGRKSEVFKTSTGRRIAPAAVENQLRQGSRIEQVVVFGVGRAQPVALIVVNEAAWQSGVAESFAAVRAEVATAGEQLPAYQRPAGLLISGRLLSISEGELTANLKLRRQVIETRYASILQELYARLDAAHGAPFTAWTSDRQAFCCSA
ncbi:MAG: AMP-binding protein [Rhodocyclaceae bacterium]|jgi:long-chain acyl-CoA synthetase|nr:AMP-binding protein [Rhodocyclaceae bacterium]